MSEEMEDEYVESELSGLLESNKLKQDLTNSQDQSGYIKHKSGKQESASLNQESDDLQEGSINLSKESDDADEGMETAQDLRVTQPRVGIEEKDVMNMFASVWVKVEVDEVSGEEETGETNSFSTKKHGKKHKRSRKTLRCESCDYTTVYKNCLNLHVKGHEIEKPYSCDKCDYATKYPTALSRHAMIKHQTEEPNTDKNVPVFKCDQCDYTSYFKWNLSAHKRKHKPEKQFKCQQCSYATAYRHNYIKHSKTHKEATVYQCDKCPFATKFEGHITRHLAKIHNVVTDKAFKCEMCDFSTKTRWRLNIHKQRSRQEKTLSCVYCEFKTDFMCEFKKHKVTHYNQIYGNGKVLYNVHGHELGTVDLFSDCADEYEPEPEKSFEELPSESKEKSQNKYLVDPNCVDWNSIQVLESEDKDRPFQCHMCNYTSRFKASVQRHFQRHHTGSQNRPYKCVNCDFSTKTKDQIALHNKRSRSEVQLFCGLCKFTTNYKCQYVMHQKCHYMNKCPKCSYSCKHKYELQKHFTTVHLGNGHKCQYCDYKASRKESLLCHETIHTGNKPFRCNHCDYMSVRRSLLNNHMKRYHSDIVTDVTIISQSSIESLRQPERELEVDANLGFTLDLSSTL